MNIYEYDKNAIKNSLSLEQMYSLLDDLGAAPQPQGSIILNKTICHCGNSHKLYYYDNTKLFKCYTDCASSFDIYELETKDSIHSKSFIIDDNLIAIGSFNLEKLDLGLNNISNIAVLTF